MTDLQIVHMEDNGELFSFNDLIGDARIGLISNPMTSSRRQSVGSIEEQPS
jgi:hypothetical protein